MSIGRARDCLAVACAKAGMLAILALGACTQQVDVAPLSVKAADPASQIPGRYAVYVGTTPWVMSSQSAGAECSPYQFQADFRPIYRQAVQGAMRMAFSQVDLVPVPLSPADLKAKGYTAQFAFDGDAIDASFGTHDFGPVAATVRATAVLVVTKPSGAEAPLRVSGDGSESSAMFLVCNQIGNSLGAAAHGALANLVQRQLDAARDDVRPVQRASYARPMF